MYEKIMFLLLGSLLCDGFYKLKLWFVIQNSSQFLVLIFLCLFRWKNNFQKKFSAFSMVENIFCDQQKTSQQRRKRFFFRSTKCFSERLVLNKLNVTCSTNHRKLISNHKRIFPMVTSLSLPPFFLPQTNHWLLFTDC